MSYCVQNRVDISSLLVVAGEHSLSTQSGLEQYRTVSRVIIHPLWENVTFENDISLVFVSFVLLFCHNFGYLLGFEVDRTFGFERSFSSAD